MTIRTAISVGMLAGFILPAVQASPVNSNDWFVGIITMDTARHFTQNGGVIEDFAPLLEVRGIAHGPDGNIYIGDNANQIGKFERSNFQTRTTVVTNGAIDSPMAVRFGPDGDMYVIAPSGTPDRIKKWDGPLTAIPFAEHGFFAEFNTNFFGFIDCDFGPNGDLFVSNWKTLNSGSNPDPSIELFDGVTGAYVGPYVPTNEPNLDNVRGLAFGPDGNLYVANYPTGSLPPGSGDIPGGEILRYQGPDGESPGTFIDIFVTNASGGVDLPQDIDFGNDSNLYVSSHFNFRTLRYQGPDGASPGEFINVFATFAATNGDATPLFIEQAQSPVQHPRPVVIGDWIVSLATNNQVRRFDPNGNFTEGVGGLTGAVGVAFGPTGFVYVASASGQGRISRLDTNYFESRTDVATFPDIEAPAALKYGPDGNMYCIVSGPNDHIRSWDGLGSATPFSFNGVFTETNSQFTEMRDFEFGPDGNLYVSNEKISGVTTNPSIERFNASSGASMGSFISTADTHMINISGIAFGRDGSLYVANRGGSNEVLRYQGPQGASPGAFMDVFVTNGSGGISWPEDIHFGLDSNLYVCSSASFQVLRYEGPEGASPGTFIDVFATFHTNGIPRYITQRRPPPPKQRFGAVIQVR